MKSANLYRIGGFAVVIATLATWEAVVRFDPALGYFLPPASIVARRLVQLVRSMEIIHHALATLRRVAAGFLLGASAGYLLGFACGYFRNLYTYLETVIESLRPMPSIALIPIGILLLGIGDRLSICVAGWACSWPVFVNTAEAVRSVDQIQVSTARTLGLSRWQTVRKVIAPSSLPWVVTALRVSLGISISLVVITEMLASRDGLGFFIAQSSISYRMPEMYAGIAAVCLMGFLTHHGFRLIERRMPICRNRC